MFDFLSPFFFNFPDLDDLLLYLLTIFIFITEKISLNFREIAYLFLISIYFILIE